MLVLSRRRGERIMIGSNVEMVVVSVQGDRVKLGFRAPTDVTIHREEIHQRIQAERAAAKGCR